MNPATLEAFRRLQAGDAAGALAAARRAMAEQPADARAHVACGIALRMQGELVQAREALERARALDPSDHAAAYESGLAFQMSGANDAALERFEEAARLRPGFAPAAYAAGALLMESRAWQRAAAQFRAVLAVQPQNADALLALAQCLLAAGDEDTGRAALRKAIAAAPSHAGIARVASAFGRHAAARGDFARAAELFTEALRRSPADRDLPLFVAQCELLEGRWAEGWAAYAGRDARREFERACLARGAAYRVPSLEALAGRDVEIVAEQGLGDILFFLRFAAALRPGVRTLRFAGDARLHPLLERTGLFDGFAAQASHDAAAPVLVADLPVVVPSEPFPRSLAIAPEPRRVQRWRERLRAAGPPPYLGLTWRAGTGPSRIVDALYKQIEPARLFGALTRWRGTVVALQRQPDAYELAAAAAALGRDVHDAADMNDDLEDALALVAVLDRHAAVSNTNIHLAAAAGATADVLVPFPPEWRWRSRGESPWFPGFRVYRQERGGDWSAALAALSASL